MEVMVDVDTHGANFRFLFLSFYVTGGDFLYEL
jgi:hypothetical protein